MVSVPFRYAAPLQQQASLSTSSVTSSLDDVASIADENFVDDETWSDLQEDSTKRKRKFRRVSLRSIKAQGLPRQKGKTCCFLALCQARTCFSPFGKDASRRCLWPWAVYVKNTETVHAGGSLHHPVIWKDGRYRPYTFNDCVWWTSHNADHGYICEITAIGVTGERLCDHLKEAKETKTETEAQLNLLLQKLAGTEDHVMAKRLSKQISQCTKALRTAMDEYNRLECSPH
ncbi:hypothetical protein ACROYT_G000648 [Oculina patagonica]